jgi:hypothetical protein
MNFNLTKEIPELAFIIEYNEKIEKAQNLLQQLLDFQQEAAIKVIETLQNYEDQNDVWFGEDLVVEFQKKRYIIKGLNGNENEPLKVRQIDHVIQIEDKQTKGSEKEKEKS